MKMFNLMRILAVGLLAAMIFAGCDDDSDSSTKSSNGSYQGGEQAAAEDIKKIEGKY